jgi:hypothetical protein
MTGKRATHFSIPSIQKGQGTRTLKNTQPALTRQTFAISCLNAKSPQNAA